VADTERDELLSLYRTLRVADVRDGMDTIMMHHVGSVSPDIKPLWRTHAVGFAKTARYVPYDGPPLNLPPEKYWDWVNWYWKEVCPCVFLEGVQPGDFIVLDLSGLDVGLIGSNNALGGVKSGAVGYLTNGGVRDTDEIILEKVPVWSRTCAQAMPQLRLQFDSKDVPVSIGGVTIHPGDIVSADGDGVIVVPRKHARDAARWGDEEHQRDKKGRGDLYKALGMKVDDTVTT
jgi:4-hydroxy-4-methyl-2-oxoglutarate aldolase